VFEKYAKDVPFVGHRCDRPHGLFYVCCDTLSSYFVIVRLVDGDPKLVWLARAIANLNLDPWHIHMIQI